MKTLSYLFLSLTLLACPAYPLKLASFVIGDTGAQLTGAGIILLDTAGEEFINESTHQNSILKSGFWRTLNSTFFRTWILILSADRLTLVADNSDTLNINAEFINPSNGNIITAYNFPVTFKIFCGSLLRSSSDINASNGTAQFTYKDSIAGRMTVRGEFSGYQAILNITNLVGTAQDTTVWCADDSGNSRVICPSGTFKQNTEVRISRLSSINTPLNSGISCIPSSGREVTAFQNDTELKSKNDFNKIMSLVFFYNDRNGVIDGIIADENNLSIYKLGDRDAYLAESTRDATNNCITANISSFSKYFIGWVAQNYIKFYQNYPNPFHAGKQTTISYELDKNYTNAVNLKIYNLNGELVRMLLENVSRNAGGPYNETWDGKNDNNEQVAPGTYLCQLIVANNIKFIKIVLVDNNQ